MKKLLALFLALIMVFALLPVSALAEEDASGETPAEEMTQITVGLQPDPGGISGEIPEEKAEETPAEEPQEPEPSEEPQESEPLEEPQESKASEEEQPGEENMPVLLAAGWNSWTSSSDKAQELVNCAKAQAGKGESDLGVPSSLSGVWCAWFVSTCAQKAGVPDNIIPNTGNTNTANGYGITYAYGLGQVTVDYCSGRYLRSDETPRLGDLVVFNGNHIGIMISSTEMVSGNDGGKVVVAKVTAWYDQTSTKYVRPDYSGSSTTKPNKTKDMSVDDYLTYYAQSVTSFSGTATPKSGTLKLYRLPETLNNTVSYTTTTGSVKLVRKIVNSAGNTWYETSTGAFAYSGDITIVASPTINDLNLAISNKGTKPYISAKIGYSSTNKPKSWSLAYGTTTALGAAHIETFTDNVLSAYNPVPISVQFGTEEPELRYGTKYYYRLSVTAQSGEVVSVEGHFTTDKCTNHTWDSGTVTTQPICCTDGVKTFKCTNPGCGETKTEAIPRTRDHKWNSGAVTKQPTCVATGIKTYTCTTPGCGATTTETVAATGKHTWDGGAVTTPAKPGEAGVKTYTCTVCSQTKTESIPALPLTYTVSYDANGGSGAPASQTKTHDEALTLSAAEPSRDGCTFLGWATDKTATSAQYQPGDSYTANADAVLYAVWEENAPSIEEQLRAAIASGESQFDIPGDCVLSADLTVPANFNLYVDQGTLTIPNGVTLTIAPEGFFGSRTNTVIQSGGKIVNNSTINSFMGGSITVEKGGTLENNWSIIVFYGGSFHNNGTYAPGEGSDLSFDIDECDLETGLTGVDRKLVTLESSSGTEASIRALFAEAENAKMAMAHLSETTALTLAGELTIPENGCIIISGNAVLTVPQGKTLTNNGSLVLFDNGRLVVESGAKLVNNDYFAVENGAQASVAGTLENNGLANVNAEGWNCTGTLTDTNEGFTLYADAATADELEAALRSGARCVNVTADIALDRSITVPQDVQLNIEPTGKLTVPATYTLACNGTITVYGTLDIGGTYSGEDVLIFEGGTLTNDSIPHRNETTLATEITITGADTLPTGGSAQYSAEILPADVWQTWVEWSIVSGKGLAAIYKDGTLVAGDTPGAITIRADAADGSGVYAEKTVTIQTAEPEPDPDEPQIVVSGETAFPGKTVKVTVSILNNPGITTARLLVSYDERLTLVSVSDGGILPDPYHGKSLEDKPYVLYWSGDDLRENVSENGVIVTLEFEVSADCPLETLPVQISYKSGQIYNSSMENVDFKTVDGGITIVNHIPGDVDGDGEVTPRDATILRRYLAGGWGISIDDFNALAADVDGDGEVTPKDATLIRRYLAGGWNVVLK